MKLYQIDPEIERLLAFEVDENGELPEEVFEKIIALNQLKESKIDNLVSYVKSLVAEAEAIRYEREELDKRIKQKKKKVERLKEFLSQFLNFEKFENARHKISFRKSEGVEIISLEDIPLTYFKAQDPVLDKVAIKDALKKGSFVEGAILYEKQNIQIK